MERKISHHNFFEELKSAHCELVGLMGEIRHALATDGREAEEMNRLITRLCNEVESHFLCEEKGGYLVEAIRQAPHLESRAEKLHKQHAVLLGQVRRLRDLTHQQIGSNVWWQRVGELFDTFTDELLTHEAHEDDLVQEAFAHDTGRGD